MSKENLPRLLVVEKDPFSLRAVSAILKSGGVYDVLELKDHTLVVQTILAADPPIMAVILSAMLPKGHGVRLLTTIKVHCTATFLNMNPYIFFLERFSISKYPSYYDIMQ